MFAHVHGLTATQAATLLDHQKANEKRQDTEPDKQWIWVKLFEFKSKPVFQTGVLSNKQAQYLSKQPQNLNIGIGSALVLINEMKLGEHGPSLPTGTRIYYDKLDNILSQDYATYSQDTINHLISTVKSFDQLNQTKPAFAVPIIGESIVELANRYVHAILENENSIYENDSFMSALCIGNIQKRVCEETPYSTSKHIASFIVEDLTGNTKFAKEAEFFESPFMGHFKVIMKLLQNKKYDDIFQKDPTFQKCVRDLNPDGLYTSHYINEYENTMGSISQTVTNKIMPASYISKIIHTSSYTPTTLQHINDTYLYAVKVDQVLQHLYSLFLQSKYNASIYIDAQLSNTSRAVLSIIFCSLFDNLDTLDQIITNKTATHLLFEKLNSGNQRALLPCLNDDSRTADPNRFPPNSKQSEYAYIPFWTKWKNQKNLSPSIKLYESVQNIMDSEDQETNHKMIILRRENQLKSVRFKRYKATSTPTPQQTALQKAVSHNDFTAANELLQNKHNPNFQTPDGWQPILIAAQKNHTRILELLIQHDASINVEKDSRTALHIAAYNGNLDAVLLLVRNNASKILTDKDGKTPLHIACERNQLEIIHLLIENNFAINQPTKKGMTPLLFAVMSENLKLIDKLVEHEANLNLKTSGKAPIDEALRAKKYKSIEKLLSYGAKCSTILTDIFLKHHVENTNTSTQHPQSIEGFEIPQRSIHNAAYLGHNKVIERRLLIDPFLLNQKTTNNLTPLHIAVASDKPETVKKLLSYSADINCITSNGYTPLLFALEKRSYELVQALLNDSKQTNDISTTRLQVFRMALDTKNPLIIKPILEKYSTELTPIILSELQKYSQDFIPIEDLSTIFQAAEMGKFSFIENDITTKNINQTDANDQSLLYIAATKGLSEIIDKLIELGADINAEINDKKWTVLHLLADNWNTDNEKTSFEALKLLLEKGADINKQNIDGETCLHIACKNTNSGIIPKLHELNVDLKIQNSAGKTALHIASMQNDIRNAMLILKLEPSLEKTQDSQGRLALHYAIQAGSKELSSQFITINPRLMETADAEGLTPLHYAALHNQYQIIGQYLEPIDACGRRRIISTQDKNGWTPIHYAAFSGNTDSMKELHTHPINITAKDPDNNTPLHLAAMKNHANTINWLIQNKANTKEENHNRQNPMDIALRYNAVAAFQALARTANYHSDNSMFRNEKATQKQGLRHTQSEGSLCRYELGNTN